MDELLIPFGINKDSGEFVEPENAPKGRACNCLCPGCNAPLLSRHPTQKRIHFAHDSRDKHAKPEKDCQFSSSVAVAMMVRSIACQFIGKLIETPPMVVEQQYLCCGKLDKVPITRASCNVIDDASSNFYGFECHVDLQLVVGDYQILIDLVHAGKPSVELDVDSLQKARAAVLELNCDSFCSSSLKQDPTLRFSDAVIAFVLKEGFRSWRFHPNAASLLNDAKLHHRCAEPELYIYGWEQPNHKTASLGAMGEMSHMQEIVRYRCIVCSVEWEQTSGGGRCTKCGSHLFARKL